MNVATASVTTPSFLAIDLGASSGRGVVGTLVGSQMLMWEVHRFRTPMLEMHGHLHWDIDALWAEVRMCIARAMQVTPQLKSISIDSWGVDYVVLDRNGIAITHPFAYRDTRTNGKLAEVFKLMPAENVYALTGTQFLPFNTLAQVFADIADDPRTVRRVSHRLLIADYLLYRLSGKVVAERTMASTTQLYDVSKMQWAQELITTIGDDPARYPDTVEPGTMLGLMQQNVMTTTQSHPMIIATCSHDTAAAVAAAPATGRESWAYISSGTWSLVGAELSAPILTNEARAAGFTNEIGVDDTIRFLKNRNGLWVLEECVREWEEAGDRPSWETLLAEAHAAKATDAIIDLNASQFAERGDMVAKILAACDAARIARPASRGALVHLVLESLAQSYSAALDELEALTGQRATVIHVFGGGARNHLLNQLTANACGRRVVAGPDEATVLGNLLLQARALRLLPNNITVRDAARQSAALTEFTPRRVQSERTAALLAH